MRIVLDIVYLLTAIGISPMVIYRVIKHKRYRCGWSHRFGNLVRKDPALKKCIWLHAVSVGEVNACKTIIKELQKRFSNYEIVMTTTTDTGFARANSIFGEDLRVFYFPLDFSWTIHRAFLNLRPSLCLLMELEVWPNFVMTARRQRIPVVVVNGRISDNSFRKYLKIRLLAKTILQKVTLILAQTEEYAQRFIAIGCPPERVIVTGSLKYDTAQITDKVDGADALKSQLRIKEDRLWVAGGTGNDEEKILLNVYQNLKKKKEFKDLRLAIVPRKPERFDEVAELIEQAGFPLIRYSQIKDGGRPPTTSKRAVILGDTMGDLRKFYSLATIIFVGRTLVPMGGSDMMEAVALGKCTMFGPHAFNFKQSVDALLADNGAIMVQDEQDLLERMQKCLTEPDFAEEIARNGQEIIRKNQGATEKTIEEIEKFLNVTK